MEDSRGFVIFEVSIIKDMTNIQEIYIPVVGYEGYYEVSNQGRVRSVDRFVRHSGTGLPNPRRGMLLKTKLNHGYHELHLAKLGKVKGFKVSRLVAQAWIPNPDNKGTVNHKNGIKTDDRVENLEWMTQAENNVHSFEVLGRGSSFEYLYGALNNSARKVFCTTTKEHFLTMKDACEKYNLDMSALVKVCKGKQTHCKGLKFIYMPYKISVIHPSRSRPDQAEKTIKLWLDNAKNKIDIEYVLSVDVDDPCLPKYKNVADKYGIKLYRAVNKSVVDAINRGTRNSTGNIIVVTSDDFSCPPDWDVKLMNELEGKEDFLLKTQDGIQPTLITLPILDRKYFDRFDYVYYKGYKHMFCDEELTTVGHMLGRVINSDLLFEHLHYSVGKSKKDELNIRNDKTWSQGKNHFKSRLKNNFGIENPLVKHSDIKWQ